MNVFSRLWTVYRLRRQFYTWDEAAIKRHQHDRVAELLRFVRAKSPYYRKLLAGLNRPALAAVPEIDKSVMMAHFDEINTARLRKEALIKFQLENEKAGTLGLFPGSYSVGVSSGTSGNKGLTVLSKKERELYGCLLWARSGIPGRVKKRRILFALRTNNPAFMQVKSFGIEIIYVDYTRQIADIIRLINEKKLNILAGPPSLLALLAREPGLIQHKIDCVISYAEVLDEAAKAMLEAAFRSPVVQIYQGSEGFIGSTCRRGRLHLNEDTILVELKEAGDAIGRAKNVVVTDLYRKTQPVIRYALNDILEISGVPCECGSRFRVIEKIHGRADDIFILKGPNGEERYLFPDYVQRSIIHASDDILEYQAIQRAPDFIEIRLVLRDQAGRGVIESAIRENLSGWAAKVGGDLGTVRFSARPPEPNPRSGKMIRVMRAF